MSSLKRSRTLVPAPLALRRAAAALAGLPLLLLRMLWAAVLVAVTAAAAAPATTKGDDTVETAARPAPSPNRASAAAVATPRAASVARSAGGGAPGRRGAAKLDGSGGGNPSQRPCEAGAAPAGPPTLIDGAVVSGESAASPFCPPATERHAAFLKLIDSAAAAALQRRHLRAADFSALAAEAGVPLFGADSLIVARVRTNQASALVCQSVEEAGRGAGGAREAEALQRRAWVVLVAFALPALHSRVVAGTLLPGRCRPAEEAFYDVEQRQQPTAGEDSGAEPAPPSAASLRRGAACVGYATALDAAHCALNLLPLHGWRGDQRARAHAFVLALLVDLVPHTAGLRLRFGGEDDLADVVECRADPECYDPTFWAALQAAWTSPPCAGVLRARGALRRGDDARAAAGAEAAARLAAGVAAAPAAAGAVAPGGGLLRCGLPSCGRREARALQFRVRGHCPALRYCCAEHAKQHWPAAHAHAPPEGGAGEAGGERNGGGTAAA